MKTSTISAMLGVVLMGSSVAAHAEIVISGSGVQIIPTQPASFHSMQVRITGPQGDVYRDYSRGDILTWSCNGCPDGAYGVDARTVVETDARNDEDKPILRTQKVEEARFTAVGGFLTQRTDGPLSRHEAEHSTLQRVASTVLDWLVPPVRAQDLTASSTQPTVLFDDTNSAYVGDEFELACDGNDSGEDNLCWFYDRDKSRSLWSAKSTNSRLDVGVGTSAPSEALHLATPQTPYILLDGPSTDFRIGGPDDITFRFVTNIGGPTGNILTLENTDSDVFYPGVGIWQSNPQAPLHVGSPDEMSANLIVENTVVPTDTQYNNVPMFKLKNVGTGIIRFLINADGSEWAFDNEPNYNPGAGKNSGLFRIAKVGTFVPEFTVDGYGNGTFYGKSYATQHINTSSREVKTGFKSIENRQILEQLVTMPITRWQYRQEKDRGLEHLGPVAEDFQATFNLGDGEHISTVDADGIALSAIKGLHEMVQEKEAELDTLKIQVSEGQERMAALEQIVQRLIAERNVAMR